MGKNSRFKQKLLAEKAGLKFFDKENTTPQQKGRPAQRTIDANQNYSKQCSGNARQPLAQRKRTCQPRKDVGRTYLPPSPNVVPNELCVVDQMTSADFRSDFAAHVENMRTRLQNQEHIKYFETMIDQNRHLFAGRTILVMRCGPALLALMAARAGAARVYAVDHSNVIDYAKLVVKANHYENVIKVKQGRVADIDLGEGVRVDGIVCNWMGHSLLYESEVLEVLQARDRWLKPHGFILPDLAKLYLLGASGTAKTDRCNWWLDVYGFNMKALRRYALAEPRFIRIQDSSVLTLAHEVMSLNLNTVTVEELQIDHTICLKVQKEDILEYFVLYFDVEFSRAHTPQAAKLSGNPCLYSPLRSLWLHTVLFIERSFVVRKRFVYAGHLSFGCMGNRQDFNEMKIVLEFYECSTDGTERQDMKVHKSWNLLQRFQTLQEVANCQDSSTLF